MTDIRRFFHDRFILFMLTINGFMALVSVITVLFRIGGTDDVYIESYRSNLGLSAVSVGGVSEMLAFALFALGLYILQIFLAIQFYKIRKSSAHIIVILTAFLLIVNFIVLNALLSQR